MYTPVLRNVLPGDLISIILEYTETYQEIIKKRGIAPEVWCFYHTRSQAAIPSKPVDVSGSLRAVYSSFLLNMALISSCIILPHELASLNYLCSTISVESVWPQERIQLDPYIMCFLEPWRSFADIDCPLLSAIADYIPACSVSVAGMCDILCGCVNEGVIVGWDFSEIIIKFLLIVLQKCGRKLTIVPFLHGHGPTIVKVHPSLKLTGISGFGVSLAGKLGFQTLLGMSAILHQRRPQCITRRTWTALQLLFNASSVDFPY